MDGEYVVELESLKDRVGYIEHEKIVKIEEDVTQIKMNQVETNTLVKEFSRAIDNQCITMTAMADSMQEMSLNMRDNNNSINTLNEKFTVFEEATTKDVEDLRSKVFSQDKKIWSFVKSNIGEIISIIAILSVVIYLVIGKVGF